MAEKRDQEKGDPTTELLRLLLIVELSKAGVRQHDIRKIAGCEMRRVVQITKLIKKAKKNLDA